MSKCQRICLESFLGLHARAASTDSAGSTQPPPVLCCSELGGLYDKCNMFAGYGRSDRKSQVRHSAQSRLFAMWVRC